MNDLASAALWSRSILSVVVLALLAHAAGCHNPGAAGDDGGAAGGGRDGAGGQGGAMGRDAASACDGAGCTCGTASCQDRGDAAATPPTPPPDAGSPPGCVCIPGGRRWCDSPTRCLWGVQDCLPDGTWGACKDTTDRPPGCEMLQYFDPCCCVKRGQCCEGGLLGGAGLSAGRCAGIVCGAAAPSACPGEGDCHPAKGRWCPMGLGGATHSWGKQTCLPEGKWGPCQDAPGPLGCDEGPTHDYGEACCAVKGYCCKRAFYGYRCDEVDTGFVGDCTGISCR